MAGLPLKQIELIISVKEARKLLSKEAKQLNDEQIKELVMSLAAIAKIYIRTIPKC